MRINATLKNCWLVSDLGGGLNLLPGFHEVHFVWHNFFFSSFTSLLLGSSLVFAFAPFNLSFLTPLVIACFYLLCKSHYQGFNKKKRQFFLGFSFGFGLFAASCYWIFISIYNYSEAGLFGSLLVVILLYIVLAVFYGGFVVSFALIGKKSGITKQKKTLNFSEALVFSSLFVLFEYLRGWIFGGFPWLYLGYSQIDNALAGYATVFGVLGIDWFLVLIAVLAGQLLISLGSAYANKKNIINKKNVLALASIALIWCGGYGLKLIDWTQADSSKPPLQFISVQPNISQEMKWSAKQAASIKKTLTELSLVGLNKAETAQQQTERLSDPDASGLSAKTSANISPKLIIWPEAALPSYWDKEKAFLRDFVHGLPPNSWLLTGTLSKQKQHWFNSIVSLNNNLASSENEQFYNKRELVPLGEFTPLSNWLMLLTEWLNLSLPTSSITSGADKQADLVIDKKYHISPFICYEIIFPDLVTSSLKDSNYLLTISNDAWFGKSIGPHQHMQIARMRALENGLPLIRVTNTGISAVTDYRGKIIASLPPYVPAVDFYSLAPAKGNTPFHYLQSWAMVILSLLLVVILPLCHRLYAKKHKTY